MDYVTSMIITLRAMGEFMDTDRGAPANKLIIIITITNVVI